MLDLGNGTVLKLAEDGGGFELEFEMDKLADGPMDWQLHERRPVQNVSDWSAGPGKARGTRST